MSKSVSLVMADDRIDVDQACQAIGAAWHSTIDSLFQVVFLFRQCLGKSGFKELQNELERRGIMKTSVFSMFKSIAENTALDEAFKDRLPPAYNTLYYLSRIDDEALLTGLIADGTVNRDLTLEDAKRLLVDVTGDRKQQYNSYSPTSKVMPVASIKVRREDFKRNKKRILALLDELEDLGLIIKRSEDLQ